MRSETLKFAVASGKAALKRVRAWEPLNVPLTSGARALLRIGGRRSEFLIKHLPRSGLVCDTLPNGRVLRLWSQGDDWIANQVFWRGWRGYEPEASSLFFRMARRSRVTLDVGAHVGFYTLLAAHANSQGSVFAFEPLPSAHGRLLRNVGLNSTANATCVEAAVGDDDGVADFYHASTDVPCSSSLSFDVMRDTGNLTRSRVRVVSLDRYLREKGIEGVDLVKVDTESTEPAVLRGMSETLRRERPSILCEVLAGLDTGPALEQALLPLGYHFYALRPEGPVQCEHIVGDPRWLNYLLTPLAPDDVPCA